MATELLEQGRERFVIAVVGGGSDTPETFERDLRPPLIEKYGPQTIVEFVFGDWRNRRENATNKIRRVHDSVSQIAEKNNGIDALIGVSMGSTVSAAAATAEEDGLRDRIGKFGFISGVMREPVRWTPWQKLAIRVYPALFDTVAQVIHHSLPALIPRMVSGDVSTVRGIKDFQVKPYLSTVNGAINLVFPTSADAGFGSHSSNIRGTLRWPIFHRQIGGAANIATA